MTMQTTDLTVGKTVTVNAPREHAFRVWTERFNDWWPSGHHIGEADMERAVIEWREGGRAYELGVDGSECDWGRVLVYEPPSRIVCSWQIGGDWKFNPDPARASEYEVRFIEQDDNTTLVEFEHRNLERHGAEDAQKLHTAFNQPSGGWAGILEGFAKVASTS
jgi:uncharacterized protein YndB with AHSA1/START domain